MGRSIKKSQNGNVMVIILIGIILFAALAYAIKGGSAPSSALRSAGEANMQADKIIAYGNAVEATVNDLMAQGVQVHQIDFRSTIFKRWQAGTVLWADNTNCATSLCRVFSTGGGQLREQVFPEATTTLTAAYSTSIPYPGHPAFFRTRFIKHGFLNSDDLVMMVVGLADEVCQAIAIKTNTESGWTGPNEDFGSWGMGALSSAGTNNYWSFEAAGITESIGNNNAALAGKTNGCARFTNFQNAYYHVLVVR